jgi:hypothetical protein
MYTSSNLSKSGQSFDIGKSKSPVFDSSVKIDSEAKLYKNVENKIATFKLQSLRPQTSVSRSHRGRNNWLGQITLNEVSRNNFKM